MLKSSKRLPKYYDYLEMFYITAKDFDKAIKTIWKSIHLGKGSNIYTLWRLYMVLGKVYWEKNDFKKAHQAFFNAKFCCRILPFGNPLIKYNYETIGNFYMSYRYFDDALWYFETIEKFCYANELPKTKHFIGFLYFLIENYESFLKVKTLLSSGDQIDKTSLCVINAMIGRLYYSKGDKDSAHSYYMEAFKLIYYYGYCLYDFNLSSAIFLIEYFLIENKIKKCETVLVKAWEVLKKNPALDCFQGDVLLIEAQLKIKQGEREEAEKCLNQIEKIYKIDKILMDPPEKIQLRYEKICGWMKFASLNLEINLLKAEKILKYIEEIFKTNFLNSWGWKGQLYSFLGFLYLFQERTKKSKNYFEKSLSIYSQHTNNVAAMNNTKKCLIKIELMEKILSKIRIFLNEFFFSCF
ncbi:unnamed protein product [Blepharisma stoltei]|uniref:Tetratricopeptide repeat protein n=1 Tax=Blepharisma stoltei TaxID=1481888 RepID=A0AAU9JEW2_9CILI|nr:unnamed protein product [Blepharisma stoltei]